MKTYKLIVAIMFAVTAYAAATTPATQLTGGDYVPGESIVKFERGIIDVPGFEEIPLDKICLDIIICSLEGNPSLEEM